jgi:hypothetical protein
MEQLPDRWLSPPEPLFWWGAAYEDMAAIRTLLYRYFQAKPGSREHFEAGRRLAREGAPASAPNTMVAFGWSAASIGSLATNESV